MFHLKKGYEIYLNIDIEIDTNFNLEVTSIIFGLRKNNGNDNFIFHVSDTKNGLFSSDMTPLHISQNLPASREVIRSILNRRIPISALDSCPSYFKTSVFDNIQTVAEGNGIEKGTWDGYLLYFFTPNIIAEGMERVIIIPFELDLIGLGVFAEALGSEYMYQGIDVLDTVDADTIISISYNTWIEKVFKNDKSSAIHEEAFLKKFENMLGEPRKKWKTAVTNIRFFEKFTRFYRRIYRIDYLSDFDFSNALLQHINSSRRDRRFFESADQHSTYLVTRD
jgi:hypothetical protein